MGHRAQRIKVKSMKLASKLASISIALLALALVGILALCVPTWAATPEQIIKIGYIANYGTVKAPMMKGSEGYGYEYFNKLIDYTSGDYTLEFVQCEWPDALDQLACGEIDVLGPTTQLDFEGCIYTESDFGESMLFLAALDEDDVYYGDYAKIEGQVIGVPSYVADVSVVEDFLSEQGINATVVQFETSDITSEMKTRGIRYCLFSSLQTEDGLKVIAKLDSAPAYYVMNESNTALMADINAAMQALSEDEYLYQAQLYLEYCNYNIMANAYISQAEYDLLQSQEVYYVGVENFYSAFSYEDGDGNLVGICFDAMEMIAEEAGVTFEYVLVDDDTTAAEYAQIDFLFLADSSLDFEVSKESDSYLELPLLLLERTNLAQGETQITTIGITDYYGISSVRQEGYIYDREVLEYTNLRELCNAFDAGEVGSIILTTAAFNMVHDDFVDTSFASTTLGSNFHLTLAFSQSFDSEKIAVFNKVISRLDDTALETSVLRHSTQEEALSLTQIIQKYPTLIINGLLVFMLVIAAAVCWRANQLAKIINTDQLTGLYSERKFLEEARKRLKNDPSGAYTFIALDIDNFKYVNEIYGYEVGTKILCRLADNIRDMVDKDSLVARSFGDNFLILMPRHLSDKRLEEGLKDPNFIKALKQYNFDENYTFSFSVGLYEAAQDTHDCSYMIDCANVARDSAKKIVGTTARRYTNAMSTERAINNGIIATMDRALAHGEFLLHYQPKIDMKTGKLCGAEVLVRWEKDGALMPPTQFIPLFERNGFIEKLDFHVLRLACAYLREHADINVPRLSVNFSGVTLKRADVVRKITSIVTEYGVQPYQLDIEITESAIVDSAYFHEKICELRAQGFIISMDDFGAGVSSLNRLKSIAFDVLKIDRGFIIDSIENERSSAILKNVMNMAKDLQLEVVAEGIETVQQYAFLKEIGCDVGQGYLFSRPVPEAAFTRYCETPERIYASLAPEAERSELAHI